MQHREVEALLSEAVTRAATLPTGSSHLAFIGTHLIASARGTAKPAFQAPRPGSSWSPMEEQDEKRWMLRLEQALEDAISRTQSVQALGELLLGEEVPCPPYEDGLDLDPYARSMGALWLERINVCKQLVRSVAAWPPPADTVDTIVMGNEFVVNVTDALGVPECRTLGELQSALRAIDGIASGGSVRALMRVSPKFAGGKIASGSWRIAPSVKYQYKSSEVIPRNEPEVDLGKWLVYWTNIALPRLALLRALVDVQLEHGIDEATPVAMFGDVPWARAAREERPGSIIVDCGSNSTKYVSAAKPTLTKIKMEDETSLKLAEVTSLDGLRGFVSYVLAVIDAADASHHGCDVYMFLTELKGTVYVRADGERKLSPEWAEWTRAVVAAEPRVRALRPFSRDDEAAAEFGTARALLADVGRPSANVAMLTCGGGTFQLAHSGWAKSTTIPMPPERKLTSAVADEIECGDGACTVVDLTT